MASGALIRSPPSKERRPSPDSTRATAVFVITKGGVRHVSPAHPGHADRLSADINLNAQETDPGHGSREHRSAWKPSDLRSGTRPPDRVGRPEQGDPLSMAPESPRIRSRGTYRVRRLKPRESTRAGT